MLGLKPAPVRFGKSFECYESASGGPILPKYKPILFFSSVNKARGEEGEERVEMYTGG